MALFFALCTWLRGCVILCILWMMVHWHGMIQTMSSPSCILDVFNESEDHCLHCVIMGQGVTH